MRWEEILDTPEPSDEYGYLQFVWNYGQAMAKLSGGSRHVLERKDGHPTHVRLQLEDERGRSFEIEGRGHNALGMHRSPNAWTWNCLTEWQWEGQSAWGEDHDNWSTAGVRKFLRGEV